MDLVFKRIDKRTAIRASFKRFLVYHEDNPHVAKDLAGLALRLHRRGHSQYGMAGLMTVLRFRHALVTTGNEAGFKISNNFGPFYSRLLMAHIPDLEDFFATRTSLADGWNWSRVGAPSLSEVE